MGHLELVCVGMHIITQSFVGDKETPRNQDHNFDSPLSDKQAVDGDEEVPVQGKENGGKNCLKQEDVDSEIQSSSLLQNQLDQSHCNPSGYSKQFAV